MKSARTESTASELRRLISELCLPSDAVVERVAQDLYHEVYTGDQVASLELAAGLDRRRHVASLSRANAGRGSWQSGWRVEGLDEDGTLAVRRGRVVFRASPQEVQCSRDPVVGGGPAVGESCRVRVPGEQIERLPGFYIAVGEARRPEGAVRYVVRLYWHLRAEVAADWMRLLTSSLNAAEVPFRLKTLSHPRHYRRADAGVLYLDPGAFGEIRAEIASAYREVQAGLRPTVPLFTKRLAPGLAIAEGPADSSSFGEHRCRLVAAALVACAEAGHDGIEAKLEAITAAFVEAGLDPRRPHLAPGSTSSYSRLKRAELGEASQGPMPVTMEDVVVGLGDRLCDAAVWFEDRCNWVGRSQDELDRVTRTFRPVVRALDAGLYRGTVGVGLFLAELFRRTGDGRHRRHAGGAALRALAAADEELVSNGFYDGRLGVAWAAQRISDLIASPELRSRADVSIQAILDHLARSPEDGLLDVYAGHAGTILALLELYRRTGDDRFRAIAERLGEVLCASAESRGEVWTWGNRRVSRIDAEPMLTGFSHGAAGLGAALLELASISGRPIFSAAAAGAFAYEDTAFDTQVGDWPDFRSPTGEASATSHGFMTAWCHGAPGIVLSRLRAMVIDPESSTLHRVVVRSGLEKTATRLDELVAEPGADTSLCHGICGLAETLLVAADVLEESELRQHAERSLKGLVDHYGAHGEWPSGTPSRGPNPSLMLGVAGVGYTLLRSLEPNLVPSILWPGSALFDARPVGKKNREDCRS